MKILAGVVIIFLAACSGTVARSVPDSDINEQVSVFTAIIIEMSEDPLLYGGTVLVDGAQGRMVFDHRRLEDIDAQVGDVVEITVTGEWPVPDPAPILPDSWRLVRSVESKDEE